MASSDSTAAKQSEHHATEICSDSSKINVGMTEREVTLVAGAAMALVALAKPLSLKALLYGGVSAMLIRRAITGHCPLYSMLDYDTRHSLDRPSAQPESYSSKSIHVEESSRSANRPPSFTRSGGTWKTCPSSMEHVKTCTRSTLADRTGGLAGRWDSTSSGTRPSSMTNWTR